MIENKFEELKVWKEAHQLVIDIYKTTKRFPAEEKFRLTDQVCRSALSIAANIVEGNSRQHKTKYHLLLAKDLSYINTVDYEKLITQCNVVGSLLGGLIKYIKSHKS